MNPFFSYRFPRQCCSCLDPCETTSVVSVTENLGHKQITHSVEVPMCNKCQTQRSILTKISCSAGLLTMLAICIMMTVTENDIASGIFMGLITGIIPALFVSALVYVVIGKLKYRMSDTPVYFEQTPFLNSVTGKLKFANKTYQKLFDDMNRGNT